MALVARAFGASAMTYSGEKDEGLEKSVKNVSENWGGSFPVEYSKDPEKVIARYKEKGFSVLHLTMYGTSLEEASIDDEKVLVIVGSEEVPGYVYHMAHYNISITDQPHSEIAALAITLDRLTTPPKFEGKIKVVPSERGKRIEKGEEAGAQK